MIFGLGNDITLISRMTSIYKRQKEQFLTRVLTESERTRFFEHKESMQFFTGRWAAKEAFAKALGTGIGCAVSFQDLTVSNRKNGAPYFEFSEQLQKRLDKLKISAVHLTIAHDGDYATATVILES